MKRRLIALIIPLCLFNVSCTTTRYVAVGCLNPEQYQELHDALPPKVGDRLTGNAGDDIKIIAGSNVRLRGYAEGLLNVLEGCAK